VRGEHEREEKSSESLRYINIAQSRRGIEEWQENEEV